MPIEYHRDDMRVPPWLWGLEAGGQPVRGGSAAESPAGRGLAQPVGGHAQAAHESV